VIVLDKPSPRSRILDYRSWISQLLHFILVAHTIGESVRSDEVSQRMSSTEHIDEVDDNAQFVSNVFITYAFACVSLPTQMTVAVDCSRFMIHMIQLRDAIRCDINACGRLLRDEPSMCDSEWRSLGDVPRSAQQQQSRSPSESNFAAARRLYGRIRSGRKSEVALHPGRENDVCHSSSSQSNKHCDRRSSPGPVHVISTIPNNSAQVSTLSAKYESESGSDDLKYEIHPAFSQLQTQRVLLRHAIAISYSLTIVQRSTSMLSGVHFARWMTEIWDACCRKVVAKAVILG
jgi:hypothetical protein